MTNLSPHGITGKHQCCSPRPGRGTRRRTLNALALSSPSPRLCRGQLQQTPGNHSQKMGCFRGARLGYVSQTSKWHVGHQNHRTEY